jgi:four helix bundle protein
MNAGFKFTSRPYEIRQRVRQFVLALISVYPDSPTWNRPSAQAWEQLFKSASSSGAHLEEADAGSSRRHFKSLLEGALREIREAKYWLMVIEAGKLEGWRTLGELTDEAAQLVAILTTIVNNTAENDDSVNPSM